jgi:hypothetical protein
MLSRISSFTFLLFGAAALAQTPSPSPGADDWTRVPGVDWERAKPESMGYSSARFEALRGWLKTQQTTALLVAVHGKVVFEYGDLSLNGKIAWSGRACFPCCTATMSSAARSM